jgi:regulator of RNase E activity RraA
VVDFRVPVRIGEVAIAPGDIIFGDIDGVIAIPRRAEAEVLALAMDKAEKENLVRTAIENGMSTVQAFATFGVM